MAQVEIPMAGQRLEFRCEQCGQGYFKRVENTPVKFKYPMLWLHQCTHCGIEGSFKTAYPRFKTLDSRQRDCFFIREEEIPQATGPTIEQSNSTVFRWLK